jgi:hypothetical protein
MSGILIQSFKKCLNKMWGKYDKILIGIFLIIGILINLIGILYMVFNK